MHASADPHPASTVALPQYNQARTLSQVSSRCPCRLGCLIQHVLLTATRSQPTSTARDSPLPTINRELVQVSSLPLPHRKVIHLHPVKPRPSPQIQSPRPRSPLCLLQVNSARRIRHCPAPVSYRAMAHALPHPFTDPQCAQDRHHQCISTLLLSKTNPKPTFEGHCTTGPE